MSARRVLVAAIRPPWRRTGSADPSADGHEPRNVAIDPADLQVLAHTMIADLFGAGLCVQNLAGRAPSDMQGELNDVAGQIDKAIRELRSFAFTNRP